MSDEQEGMEQEPNEETPLVSSSDAAGKIELEVLKNKIEKIYRAFKNNSEDAVKIAQEEWKDISYSNINKFLHDKDRKSFLGVLENFEKLLPSENINSESEKCKDFFKSATELWEFLGDIEEHPKEMNTLFNTTFSSTSSDFRQTWGVATLIRIVTFIPDMVAAIFKSTKKKNVIFNPITASVSIEEAGVKVDNKKLSQKKLSEEEISQNRIDHIQKYSSKVIFSSIEERYEAYAQLLKNPNQKEVENLLNVLEKQHKELNLSQTAMTDYMAIVLAEISQHFSQYADEAEITQTEGMGVVQWIRKSLGFDKKTDYSTAAARQAALKEMGRNIDLSWFLASFATQVSLEKWNSVWLKKAENVKTEKSEKLAQFFSKEYVPMSTSFERYAGYMSDYYSPETETLTLAKSVITPRSLMSLWPKWMDIDNAPKEEIDLINRDMWDNAEKGLTKLDASGKPIDYIDNIGQELLESKSSLLAEELEKIFAQPSGRSDFLLFFEKLNEKVSSFELDEATQKKVKRFILTTINTALPNSPPNMANTGVYDISKRYIGVNLENIAELSRFDKKTEVLFFKNMADYLSCFSSKSDAQKNCQHIMNFQGKSPAFQKALFHKALENISQNKLKDNVAIKILDKNYVADIKTMQSIHDKYLGASSAENLAREFLTDLKKKNAYNPWDSREKKSRKNAFDGLIQKIDAVLNSNENNSIMHEDIQRVMNEWKNESSLHAEIVDQSQHFYKGNVNTSVLFKSMSSALEHHIKQNTVGTLSKKSNHSNDVDPRSSEIQMIEETSSRGSSVSASAA